MTKNLFYTALWLMGLMGTLVIWVVNASNFVTTVPWLVVTWEQDGQTFEYWVLKFNDGSGHVIMLLDRNLWATMTWAWADANTGSYWFKYQWWNNHWFADGCWSIWFCTDTVTTNATWRKVEYKTEYDNSNYSWTTFIISTGNYWEDSEVNSENHMNLWWGGNDTSANQWWLSWATEQTIKNRQWPCPKGYHVPSIQEWNNLFVYWYNAEKWWNLSTTSFQDRSETNIWSRFSENMRIPFAGFRNNSVAQLGGQGASIYLWSSSPNSTTISFSRYFSLFNDSVKGGDNGFRALGFPIRCFSDAYLFPYKYSFIDGDIELKSWSIISGERIIDIINFSELNTTKEWYDFNYWYIQWAEDTKFDFAGTFITGNIELYAKRKPIEYTITYELDGWVNNSKNVTWYTIEDTVTFENPKKDWYTFDGWFSDKEFTTWVTSIPVWTTWNIILYAKWTENIKPSWGYSGWGGRSSRTSDKDKDTTNNPSVTDVTAPLESGAQWDSNDGSPLSRGDTASAERGSTQNYSQEFQEAYEFAHEKWITTMPTINDANMNWKLTRIAMAKMLSYYAINVLWQKPDETRNNKFNDITDKLDAQYDSGVTLAYQLWIMWINMPDNMFRPNDEVTRAEFVTALSRMLYSTPDGKPYYATHLQKLKAEWILKNDDYKMKELRGYVMIMLKRSAK